MWQVYLYLANERQIDERHEIAKRRVPSESRFRRWRTARRAPDTQHVVTQAH